MNILRTPDERFVGLPGWPFEPRYAEVDGLRMHYVDEGPPDAETVLLIHGEPTWSYLYRKMIPVITGAGLRAVAPDFVGFGRSDKPSATTAYTYANHVAWLRGLVESLDLRAVTLVGQDWGGLIGLRALAEDADRYARVVAANTGLPTGGQRMSEAWRYMAKWVAEVEELPVSKLVATGCLTRMPDEVKAAYDAPFPDESYKAGARMFPQLVPTSPEDPARAANLAAWEVLGRWERPFLCAFGDSDPMTAGADSHFRERVPGTRGQPHVTLEGVGHFIQEDAGEELARVIVDFVERTRA